jgi:glc operon protein GlcG
MRRVFTAVFTFVLVAGYSATTSLGQAAPPATAPAAATPGTNRLPPNTPPQQIDVATAKKMVAAVEAVAAAMNQHVAICVMDTRGDMVFFERMDTINVIPVGSAQAKAHAVLLFGIPSGQIGDAMRDGKPLVAKGKAPLAGYGEMDFRQGGLPIMKNGKMIGAIGVGGSASESDEQFAQAGIDAVTQK